MEIGKPLRKIVVEPIRDPVPARRREPLPEPVPPALPVRGPRTDERSTVGA
jgi:hypothetical protein